MLRAAFYLFQLPAEDFGTNLTNRSTQTNGVYQAYDTIPMSMRNQALLS